MKISVWFCIILFCVCLPCGLSHAGSSGAEAGNIVGRWDITVNTSAGTYPSWLEIHRSGYRTLVGRFVGRWGSARPISQVHFDGDTLRFTLPPQWESRTSDLVFEGVYANDTVRGWTIDDAGNRVGWTGVRAPHLRRTVQPAAAKPLTLIDGSGLRGWHCLGGQTWNVADGVLVNGRQGGNLVTDSVFTDFRLHLEFRYPKGGNSGVYLRGRYEVQVEDSRGMEPACDRLGAVYGFLPPSEDAAGQPDTWQTMDIELIGRMVTVHINGIAVIERREIPGITGGALDSDESRPGPIMLQGDHGPVQFRNIVITPMR